MAVNCLKITWCVCVVYLHMHTHTHTHTHISGRAILETAHDIVGWINWFCDMIQTYAFCKHGVEQITDHLRTHSLYCSTCCHASLYFSLVTSAHLLNRSEVLHIYIVCSFYHTRIMSIIVNKFHSDAVEPFFFYCPIHMQPPSIYRLYLQVLLHFLCAH